MKLFFAIKRLDGAVGGAERVFCSVCSALANRGHEVTVLTFDRPGGQPFYSLDQRVTKIDLGIGCSSQPAGLIETIVRIKALRRTINAERPDVAIGFMHSMFVPLAFALVGTFVPVLGSEHIVPDHYQTRRLQYLLLMLASPFLCKLTVLSRAIRSRYPLCIRRRMVEMPNPVEVALTCKNVDVNSKTFTLLSVGRLDPQKDQATLIRAFAGISNQFTQWHLKIIGDGALREDLVDLIAALNMQGRVIMQGVTRNIFEEYLSADVFAIPSRYEAFGLVTAEAMSHGLPVVGFADCPGTNELIESGKTGLLVQPGSDRVAALAYGLSRLFSAPPLRLQLGNAGREAIKKQWSLSKVCDEWEHLLHSVNKRK